MGPGRHAGDAVAVGAADCRRFSTGVAALPRDVVRAFRVAVGVFAGGLSGDRVGEIYLRIAGGAQWLDHRSCLRIAGRLCCPDLQPAGKPALFAAREKTEGPK